jgi:hypothetical protein
LGYTKETFLNDRQFFYNNCIHPYGKERVLSIAINRKYPKNYKFRVITKSGEIKSLQETVLQITDCEKECILCIYNDVTDWHLYRVKSRSLEMY